MNNQDLLKQLKTATMEYEAAKGRGIGLSLAKERMKNFLFNNYADIIQALGQIETTKQLPSEPEPELSKEVKTRGKKKMAAGGDADGGSETGDAE